MKTYYDELRTEQQLTMFFLRTTWAALLLLVLWSLVTYSSATWILLVIPVILYKPMLSYPSKYYGTVQDNLLESVDIYLGDECIAHFVEIKLKRGVPKLYYGWIKSGHKLKVVSYHSQWYLEWFDQVSLRHLPLKLVWGDRLQIPIMQEELRSVRLATLT